MLVLRRKFVVMLSVNWKKRLLMFKVFLFVFLRLIVCFLLFRGFLLVMVLISV